MKRVIIKLIKFYQKHISIYCSGNCRFYPVCSQYFIESVETFGAFRGSLFGLKRLLKCNPFSKEGYDPVKTKK